MLSKAAVMRVAARQETGRQRPEHSLLTDCQDTVWAQREQRGKLAPLGQPALLKVDCATFSVLDTNLLTRCCVQVAWQNGKDSFFLSSPVAVLRPFGATMAMGGKA